MKIVEHLVPVIGTHGNRNISFFHYQYDLPDHFIHIYIAVEMIFRGTLDVVIANQKGRALLYRNALREGGNAGHWVEFKLIGTRSNRSAIGAEVTVEFGAARQRQVVDGGMGFCSQNDRRLHFGLGDQRLGRVTIRWPSGTAQVLEGLTADRLHVITEPK